MNSTGIAAVVILVATDVGVAAGGVPGLRRDRVGVAFLGGAAMIALGPLSLDEAFGAIDFHTIARGRGGAPQSLGRIPSVGRSTALSRRKSVSGARS